MNKKIKVFFDNYGVDIIFIVGLFCYLYFKYYFHPFLFDTDKAIKEINFPDTIEVNYELHKKIVRDQFVKDSINGDYDEPVKDYQGSAD